MIRVAAPAKINLYLHVVGRRADGYHLLDSLVVFADLHDEVAAAPADDLTLAIAGPFAAALSDEPDNLVLRAARALAAAHRIRPTARLTLTKAIPVAAGLGGSSADAAAALRALSELWSVAIPEGLAISLGADVPACLAGQPLFLSGIGETVAPAPVPPGIFLVLVNPGVQVPTAEIFRRRQGAFSSPARFERMPGDALALAALLGERRNDLTEAAIECAPIVADALRLVAATKGCLLARMSGSGATVFGICASKAEAAEAGETIARVRPAWWSWSGAIGAPEGPLLTPSKD